MPINRLFLKAASFTLLICFIVQDFSFAAGEIKPAALDLFEKPKVSLKFPDSVAQVEDSFFFEQGAEDAASRSTLKNGNSRLASLARTRSLPQLVYLLQDAHTNTSGQINLSKTLDHLLKEDKSLKYVFVEAGVGNNSLSFLRSQATPGKRKQVAEEFVRKGLLHGEEYLDMTGDPTFTIWGVEDPSLYSQSLELYKRSVKQREKFQSYLDKVEGSVKSLKTKIYNPALLIMDEKREKFLKEEMSFTDYLSELEKRAQLSSSSEAPRRGAESRSTSENSKGSSRRGAFGALLEQEGVCFYPHLHALKALRQQESLIDFKKAQEEQQKAIQSLSSEDQKEVLSYLKEDKTKPFIGGGIEDLQRKEAFYAMLEERLGRTQFAPTYPNLNLYFQYLSQAKAISPQEILKEQKLLETQVFQSLAQTQDEQILFKISKNVRDLRKLFNLTLTPEEYQTYEKDPRGFNIAFITGFLNRKIMDLGTLYENTTLLESGYGDAIKTCEEFYKLTTQRDEAFIKNMLAKMDSGKRIAESGKENTKSSTSAIRYPLSAILITGGFHTPNLKALLKSRGISYISITPQVYHETNQKRYEQILLNQKLDTKIFGPTASLSSNHMRTVPVPLAAGRLAIIQSSLRGALRSPADLRRAKENDEAVSAARLVEISDIKKAQELVDIHISGLSVDGKTLLPNEIKALSPNEIQALTPDQIQALTPDQIQALTPDQIQVLTRAQIQVLSLCEPNRVSFSRGWDLPPTLYPDQIGHLSLTQITYLLPWQIEKLDREYVSALSPDQIRAFLPKQILFFSPTQISFLSPAQIKTLSPDQIKALWPDQIGVLVSTQIQALSPDHIKAISEEQLSAFDKSQLKQLLERAQELGMNTTAARLADKNPENKGTLSRIWFAVKRVSFVPLVVIYYLLEGAAELLDEFLKRSSPERVRRQENFEAFRTGKTPTNRVDDTPSSDDEQPPFAARLAHGTIRREFLRDALGLAAGAVAVSLISTPLQRVLFAEDNPASAENLKEELLQTLKYQAKPGRRTLPVGYIPSPETDAVSIRTTALWEIATRSQQDAFIAMGVPPVRDGPKYRVFGAPFDLPSSIAKENSLFPAGIELSGQYKETPVVVTGDNAWFGIIAPLQVAHMNGGGFIDRAAFDQAMKMARTLVALQAPNGGIYLAPKGTPYIPYRDISNAHAITVYAALKMILEASVCLTQEEAAPYQGDLEKIRQAMKDIETYIQKLSFDRQNSVFHAGGKYKGDTDDFEITPNYASDVPLYAIEVLGPKTLDGWFGEGRTYEIWQKVKEKAGRYDSKGDLVGIGLVEGHEAHAESTTEAIRAVEALAAYYSSDPRRKRELENETQTLRRGLEGLVQSIPGSSARGILESSAEVKTWWGATLSPKVHVASTAQALMFFSGFDPLKLGGKTLQAVSELRISLDDAYGGTNYWKAGQEQDSIRHLSDYQSVKLVLSIGKQDTPSKPLKFRLRLVGQGFAEYQEDIEIPLKLQQTGGELIRTIPMKEILKVLGKDNKQGESLIREIHLEQGRLGKGNYPLNPEMPDVPKASGVGVIFIPKAARLAESTSSSGMTRRRFVSGVTTAAVAASPLFSFLNRVFGQEPKPQAVPASSPLSVQGPSLVIPVSRRLVEHKPSADHIHIVEERLAGPWGGIGTGSGMRNLDGQFGHLFFSALPSDETFPEAQISVRVSQAGKVFAAPLGLRPAGDERLTGWNWKDAERISQGAAYKQNFPNGLWEYGELNPEIPVRCTLKQFSPFIPRDTNVSTEPVVFTELEFANPTGKDMEITGMLSMPNFAGWKFRPEPEGPRDHLCVLDKSGENQTHSMVETPTHLGVVMSGTAGERDLELVGQLAIVTEKQEGVSVTYHTAFDAQGSGKEVWSSFEKKGELDNVNIPNSGAKEQAGAVAVKVTLKPGERRVIRFAFAFDIPNDVRNGVVNTKSYANRWGDKGNNAFAIASNALNHRLEWSEKIDAWQSEILNDPKLPEELKIVLVNELYYLVHGGSLITTDGRVFILEGKNYRIHLTSDVLFYMLMTINRFFPDLAKKMVTQLLELVPVEDHELVPYYNPFPSDLHGRNAPEINEAFRQKKGFDGSPTRYEDRAKNKGAAVHHVDRWAFGPYRKDAKEGKILEIHHFWQNHNGWKDLSPKLVLMALLVFKDDTEALKKFWPNIVETLAYQKGFARDGSGGLPYHGGWPDSTFDTLPLEGVATYSAVLTTQALVAAIKIGETIGADKKILDEYRKWLATGKATIEKKLWDPRGHYRIDEQEEKRDYILAGALDGLLYAKLLGLEPVLPDDHVRSHLDMVYQHNFRQFGDGTVGATNVITLDGKTPGSKGDIQAGEVWFGIETAVMALMIYYHDTVHRLKDKALEILKVHFDRTWNGGYQNRTPEGINIKGDFREGPYGRAMGIGAVAEALKGGARLAEPTAPPEENAAPLLSGNLLEAVFNLVVVLKSLSENGGMRRSYFPIVAGALSESSGESDLSHHDGDWSRLYKALIAILREAGVIPTLVQSQQVDLKKVSGVSISPSGRFLIWNFRWGTKPRHLLIDLKARRNLSGLLPDGEVLSLVYSKKENIFLVISKKEDGVTQARVIDTDAGREIFYFESPGNSIKEGVLSHDGKFLVLSFENYFHGRQWVSRRFFELGAASLEDQTDLEDIIRKSLRYDYDITSVIPSGFGPHFVVESEYTTRGEWLSRGKKQFRVVDGSKREVLSLLFKDKINERPVVVSKIEFVDADHVVVSYRYEDDYKNAGRDKFSLTTRQIEGASSTGKNGSRIADRGLQTLNPPSAIPATKASAGRQNPPSEAPKAPIKATRLAQEREEGRRPARTGNKTAITRFQGFLGGALTAGVFSPEGGSFSMALPAAPAIFDVQVAAGGRLVVNVPKHLRGRLVRGPGSTLIVSRGEAARNEVVSEGRQAISKGRGTIEDLVQVGVLVRQMGGGTVVLRLDLMAQEYPDNAVFSEILRKILKELALAGLSVHFEGVKFISNKRKILNRAAKRFIQKLNGKVVARIPRGVPVVEIRFGKKDKTSPKDQYGRTVAISADSGPDKMPDTASAILLSAHTLLVLKDSLVNGHLPIPGQKADQAVLDDLYRRIQHSRALTIARERGDRGLGLSPQEYYLLIVRSDDLLMIKPLLNGLINLYTTLAAARLSLEASA